tara:strand:- start:36 stop:590 length:555 start_codon:yes stop_codon:yes gene_type:complete
MTLTKINAPKAATGILPAANGGTAVSSLPLPVSGGGTGLTSRIAFQATKSSNQTVVAQTDTTCIYDTEILDTNNGYNTSTGVYTVPVAGWWNFSAMIRLGYSSTGDGNGNTCVLRKNGGVLDFSIIAINTNSQIHQNSPRLNMDLLCAVGDTIDVQGKVGGNGTIFYGSPSHRPSFSGHYLGAA